MTIQPYIHAIWMHNPLPYSARNNLAQWSRIARQTGYHLILWVDKRFFENLKLDMRPPQPGIYLHRGDAPTALQLPYGLQDLFSKTSPEDHCVRYFLTSFDSVLVCCYETLIDSLRQVFQRNFLEVPFATMPEFGSLPLWATADDDDDSLPVMAASDSNSAHKTFVVPDKLNVLFNHAVLTANFEKTHPAGRLDVVSDILRMIVLACFGGFYFDCDVSPSGMQYPLPRPEEIFVSSDFGLADMLARPHPLQRGGNVYENDLLGVNIAQQRAKENLLRLFNNFQLKHPLPSTRIDNYQRKVVLLLVEYHVSVEDYELALLADQTMIIAASKGPDFAQSPYAQELMHYYHQALSTQEPRFDLSPLMRTLKLDQDKLLEFRANLLTALGHSIYESMYGLTQEIFRNPMEWRKIQRCFSEETIRKVLCGFMVPGINQYSRAVYAAQIIQEAYRKSRARRGKPLDSDYASD